MRFVSFQASIVAHPDHPKSADLAGLIDALLAGAIEFIVVGGASAVLHGALAMTQDLDIVYRMTPENFARLTTVLDRLQAYVRELGQRRLRPDASHLASGGQINLLTTLGPLDLLGRLHDGRGYDDLVPHSEVLSDAAGASHRSADTDRNQIQRRAREGSARHPDASRAAPRTRALVNGSTAPPSRGVCAPARLGPRVVEQCSTALLRR